ncbi:MAG TPA: hypothetical protein VFL34_20225 [Candidatus Sulfotelmatobacter sp.]|nr:hypothetical protein [Candidatus Sulfotelmatobacter sp.]
MARSCGAIRAALGGVAGRVRNSYEMVLAKAPKKAGREEEERGRERPRHTGSARATPSGRANTGHPRHRWSARHTGTRHEG